VITVNIGQEQRSLHEATPEWINQQIQRRRADGESVCVRVSILEGGLDMALSTPNYMNSGGGGRPPSSNEKEIFHLWRERGLDDPHFSGGNLVAFLAQLKRSFA